MVTMALVLGSAIGTLAGIFGWLALGLAPLSAFGLYLGCAFGLAALAASANLMRATVSRAAPKAVPVSPVR
ncbi:hypothetical protein LVO79_01435 [Roseivivax marinus]|jgi:hypothetical protein|uniref:hypothetical protein n=1 Tax=Roseivivax marinus TaxID=1379903 RepID=UPI001F0434F6|nr:hypothetical protein [Roseivivax marinus]UMA65166.1 hypothetical protein LVO79_01435 [Roseivivax marinus]